jgi:DNA-binding beta-propeller fold protein YncE
MKFISKLFSAVTLALSIGVAWNGSAEGTRLYLTPDIHSNPALIDVYDINQSGNVTFQALYAVPFLGDGVAGLALDSFTHTLFVTYEFSNAIQILNSWTMEPLGVALVPGAFNLAGIVMDEGKRLLYVADRYTANLYIYRWDPLNNELTLVEGAPKYLIALGGWGAFGLGVDSGNGHLYVANSSDTIPYYRTDDWTLAGFIVVSGPAINVTVDSRRRLLYSGGGWGIGNDYLDQYDLATGDRKRVLLGEGSGVLGLGINTSSGNVYLTTDDKELRVYTPALELQQNAGLPVGAGNPAGLVVESPYCL